MHGFESTLGYLAALNQNSHHICYLLVFVILTDRADFANTAPQAYGAVPVAWQSQSLTMSRRPTRRRTADDETADDERAYGTDGYWQRRYTARAQGSGLSASAAGVQEDVTYATQARTPDSQTGLLLTL